jgi:Mg-chelatase subunit ChlD
MALRRRGPGLPAPLWVGRASRARRKRRAPIVVSIVIHTLVALMALFVLSTATTRHQKVDLAMAIEFVSPLRDEPEVSRPLKRLVRLAQASPTSPDWEQRSSPIPQTIEYSDRPILNPANPEAPKISTDVDVVTTAAKTRADAEPLSTMRSLSSKPTPGHGALTGVVRPRGAGGRNVADSSGAVAVGLPGGAGTGEGQGRGDGTGTAMGSPFQDALARIGENLAASNITGKVDVLFVIDTSGSMADNIRAVAGHLFDMTDRLDAEDIEYQLGVAAFRELGSGAKVELSGWSIDPQTLRTRMESLGVVGNERALDALIQTLQLTRFRADADKAMVFVTDEPATTKWGAKEAAQQMRDRVLSETMAGAIRVQVLGVGEAFQKNLAAKTGGLFQTIPRNRRVRLTERREPTAVILPPRAFDTEFRGIAGDVRRWANPSGGPDSRPIDVLLLIDVSGSMQGRLRASLYGLGVLESALTLGGLEPAYTVVRFAKARGVTGSGVRGVDVGTPVTSVDSIQRILQYPAVGDERLLDAIAAGLASPSRQGVPRIAVIITDEPPSGDSTDIDAVVQMMGATTVRFYALMPQTGVGGDPALRALTAAVDATGGETFVMPEAHHERLAGE